MKTILFQGDSITDGNRYKLESQRWDLNHQIGHSYVYPIAAKLGAEYPELHLNFLNRGVSGNNVWDLKERWEKDTLELHPDILSILIGTNDVGRLAQFDGDPSRLAAAFEKTYNEVLETFRGENKNSKIIILEPFRLPLDKENHTPEADAITEIALAAKRVADKNDAVFIPLQERFNSLCVVREPKYWVWDGKHPTESGHWIIAKEWMDAAGRYAIDK